MDAFRARGSKDNWYSDLPLVLLGLRVAPKEDSGLSSAEMLYGTTLSVPGSFLTSADLPGDDFFKKLRLAFDKFEPPPAVHHAAPSGYLDPRLKQATHVFVRRDGHVPPLEPLYSGPFTVVSRGEKFFTVQVGNKQDTISVDRLKVVQYSQLEVPVQDPPK